METGVTVNERCITVGLHLPSLNEALLNDHLDELEELLDTAGAVTIARVIQKRAHPDPATYIGKGKAQEIDQLARANDAKMIVFDDDLSPAQVKNLENIIEEAKILDRSTLIMDIFASHAQTSEARTQVELAQYRYLLPRLTRQWTHLSRQVGGIGVRGVGETQLETDRRIISRRILHLEKQLKKIERSRKTQRSRRYLLPRVSIVGYTNAGKSTLFNRLTQGEQLVENRLFATLDSKVSRVVIDNDLPVLFADTVGFIRKLPHHLVASFRSTLEETTESDLVLLLLDISQPALEEHRSVALEVLEDLGVDSKRILVVYNKIDRNTKGESPHNEPAVSALTGEGIGPMLTMIRESLLDDFIEVTYTFKIDDSEGIQQCMRRGTVQSIEQKDGETLIRIRLRRSKA